MKTLVLNCGSSSIKYKLFDMTSGEVMVQGGLEKVGLEGSFFSSFRLSFSPARSFRRAFCIT